MSELIARKFHEAYERLAPAFSYKTREASAVPWADVPDNNKQLMIAVVAELVDNGIIEQPEVRIRREWIAVNDRLPDGQPGENFLWYQPKNVNKRSDVYSLRARCVIDSCKPSPRLTTHWQPLPAPPEHGGQGGE